MYRTRRLSRRAVMKASGATGVALLAGCIEDEPDEDDEPDDEVEPDDDNDDDDDDNEWADVDAFHFEGRIEAWTGVEPSLIEGEDNPTITLIEGQEYDFSWENADGVLHNMEIRDADGDVIDDYQSDDVDEEGGEATIEGVVATEEMDVYICRYHTSTQVGDIEVQSE